MRFFDTGTPNSRLQATRMKLLVIAVAGGLVWGLAFIIDVLRGAVS